MKPIIDLHLHLDGSLPVDTVDLLMKKYPERVPENLKSCDTGKLISELQAPADCKSLAEYLTRFDLPCSLLQCPESLAMATAGVLKSLAAEGVKYVEIRFAPQLHSREYEFCPKYRLDYEREIMKAMIEATHKVPEIKCSFILCCMRNLPDKDKLNYDPNLNTLVLAEEFLGKGVVAVDLAGAEARDETEQFKKLFKYASNAKIPFTIHAGEAGDITWRLRSLESALAFGAKRIGHGIALEHSAEMREFCKENRIGIECCPISNLQTKAVLGGIQNHPLPKFLKEGLLVSVNTDNRTVSNTTLAKEFVLLSEAGIGEAEKKQLTLNAIEMSFADEATKAWLKTLII